MTCVCCLFLKLKHSHITTAHAVSAADQRFPPFVIFKDAFPEWFQDDLIEYDGWLFGVSPNGFIN